ncbi:glycoside hydrolase family 20 protein [Heterobasidion irregulare TC 32-1]|uniref:Beta-hexosaminidase n=1 Tax=Heterobasidion irregulare (strain TC 32-1) TaxID=747525 RepID=W4KA45_HETIT|nr:glycoside hydrolase family 20 protein [Heterobasidion irregulare TC 32-1]ETW82220.1 glycoside hydrolase family 20 protein [Heterobasidion irregulare TC 32-1]
MMIALLGIAIASLISPAVAVWPQPRTVNTGSEPLRLSPTFSIQLAISNAPADLRDAVHRSQSFLQSDKLERLVVGRGASDAQAIAGAHTLPSLTITLSTQNGKTVVPASITDEARAPLGSRDEAYTLGVPSDGTSATLTANSTLGLFRGLTTFEQMWYWWDSEIYTLEAPITIEDAPVYPYRGFMLDTARNFFPVDDIKRTLDAMSWVKLNTLHWHATDSQSFPLEIPGFTELSEKGAYSSSSVYHTDDISDIVAYAGARGIDVLVEIDTPGHTAVMSQSHPEFVACAETTPWASFANEPPAGQLRLASPSVIKFTASLFSALAKLFPSTLISSGGDEVNTNCYTQDAETQQQLDATGQNLAQALDSFVGSVHEAIRGSGKTPVVWEEMVLDYNVTLPNDTVVMVWISSENAAAVAQKGYRFVHAASDYFYLDCGAGEWIGADIDGNSWCDPFKTWQKSYSFNPTANLSEAEASLVLGGEHCLWTEQSSPSNLDSITWPRAASGAELFWTGPGGNVSSALPRLHDVAYRMEKRGVKVIKLQPEWCALRPGVCDLTA